MSLPPPPSIRTALGRSWRDLTDDPVRLLGLSAVALLADLAWGTAVIAASWRLGAPAWDTLVLGWMIRAACVALVRWRLLTLAAGLPAGGLRGARTAIRLVAVDLLGATVALLGAATLGALPAFLALLSLAQGMLPSVVLFGASTLVAGWMGGVAGRALLVPAQLAVVLDGRGLPGALRAVRRAPTGSWAWSVRLLVSTDIVRLLGSLVVVAGALPAYPMSLLAARARWDALRAPEAVS